MVITPEYLAVRVVNRFHKMGGPGRFARQFEKLGKSAQAFMLENAQLDSDELPLLACYFDRSSWALITTERLIWCAPDQTAAWWRLAEIEEVAVDSEKVLQAGKDWKLNWERLLVRSSASEEVELRLEPGKPFFAFWNALADANRISKRRKGSESKG